MKVIIPILITLVGAIPVSAFQLADPLVIEIVTSWPEAMISGGTVEAADEIPVDRDLLHRLDSFKFERGATVVGASFAVQREAWKKHYWGCVIKAIRDPKVPIIHIVFDGDGDVDEYKPRANRHDEEFSIVCYKIVKK